ncbi:MAG: hypothetical protein A3D28_04215 [Omnitrophica bacterium RIFCSPHIGHO2_02_FULL_63_14]|nr:MAG: hypothetical protein A3D28_04215 [Omnitrophica bacterium RIFCSPHIGHO2_02_FULL_63_14]
MPDADTSTRAPGLETLLARWSHHPFHHLKVAEAKVQQYLAALLSAAEGQGAVLSTSAHGIVTGCAVIEPLPWDTSHFGVVMAKLSALITDSDAPAGDRRVALQGLLEQVRSWCRQHAVQHLSARVDVGDVLAAQALETAGFRLMDTSVYAVYHPARVELPAIKSLGTIRLLQAGDDLEALVNFARTGFRRFRFHADPHLPADRSDELYAVWIRNLAKPGEAFVNVHQGGQIVGFAPCLRHTQDSEGLGIRIGEVGTTAVLPTARGTYPGLLRAALAHLAADTDVVEVLTSARNLRITKTWNRLGLEPAKMTWVFHGWMDDWSVAP